MSWNALRAVRNGRSANHCERVNEACRFCYAERQNFRLSGLPFKPGYRRYYTFVVDEKKLLAPLRRKKPTRIFVESMSDAFGEWWPDEFIDQLYAVMALSPQHTYINLSKRPERRRNYLVAPEIELGRRDEIEATIDQFHLNGEPRARHFVWPLPNVIEGVSVSCQKEAEEFVPILLRTPAAIRCISAEPLLGPTDLEHLRLTEPDENTVYRTINALTGRRGHGSKAGYTETSDPLQPHVDWVIVGGESGQQARPMNPEWARSLRDQCNKANVPYFFKQWGEWLYDERVGQKLMRGDDQPYPIDERWSIIRVGKKAAGRLLDGRTWDEMPGEPR
jgi:protein gp37